jgi:hypothetical protein
MKNKKFPKTHTVLGVKCKYNKKSLSWKGETDQFRIEIYDREVTYRHPNDKRYLVNIILRTFHQVQIDGTGDTLKEAQEEILSHMKEDTNEYKQLLWDTQGAFYYAQR